MYNVLKVVNAIAKSSMCNKKLSRIIILRQGGILIVSDSYQNLGDSSIFKEIYYY